ncbi:LysE/ArgO family amino acid transporter [Stenoxybacter acetivorans]|uniref:LysE/ArgO family amino acid transporter n=1 Tax=Stenoxybacter acetivorans TaxID=422441 RepID=UPI00055AA0CB|nr:LysE family transporter [Stenoxybacter acetivorans]
METFYIVKGALLSGSMIMAIGAQNIFIIKNGIGKNHIFLICSICFICNILLMSLGIFVLGSIFQGNKILTVLLALTGGCFLLFYAFSSLKSAFLHKHGSLSIDATHTQKGNMMKITMQTLSVTLLNPQVSQVYLDTVVIVGGVGATLTLMQKYAFLIGSLLASFLWFFGLGIFAKYASRFFSKPKSLLIMDLVIGFILLGISAGLFQFAYRQLA